MTKNTYLLIILVTMNFAISSARNYNQNHYVNHPRAQIDNHDPMNNGNLLDNDIRVRIYLNPKIAELELTPNSLRALINGVINEYRLAIIQPENVNLNEHQELALKDRLIHEAYQRLAI